MPEITLAILDERLAAEEEITSHQEVDLKNVFEWLDRLEKRVTAIEGLSEVMAAISADIAAINDKITAHFVDGDHQ